MSAVGDVRHLMSQVYDYELSMPPGMDHASLLDIAAVYNGIGPAWAPEWFRKALNNRLSIFQAAALIHDYEYSLINRNMPYCDDIRALADERFWDNMRRSIAAHHGIMSPIRYALEVRAFWAWRAVRRLGGASID